MLNLGKLLCLCGLTGATVANAQWIVSGTTWKDTAGKTIDAHGGGVYNNNGTFLWVGWSAANNWAPNLYSSTDLVTWTPHGIINPINQYSRPKMAYLDGKFWVYGQKDRLVYTLSSTNPYGPYKQVGSGAHLEPNNYTYEDEGIFQDDDGKWYLLTSADHNTLQINVINDDGTIGALASSLTDGPFEAPGMLKSDGVYYLVASAKTGWKSNPDKFFSSSSLKGPWTQPADIAPPATDSYDTQDTFELKIAGSQQTTWIYMGDRWGGAAGNTGHSGSINSQYVWTPWTINTAKRTVTVDFIPRWKIDLATGVVTTPAAKKRYEAEHATISGRGTIGDCEDCISKRAVHGMRHGSDIEFRNVEGKGGREWVSLYYTANKAHRGDAMVHVNNMPPIRLSELHSGAGKQKSTPIQLELKAGCDNVIRVTVSGARDFDISVDGLEIYED